MRRLRLATLLLTTTLPVAAAWPSPPPSTITFTVRETAGVGRTSEVVRSGVPLPRSLAITSTASLAAVDAQSAAVPAEFQVLARWDAGLASSAPIQWLLVSFPATVSANASAACCLVTNGSVANPAPATPVSVNQVGDQVTVSTGAAIFKVGGTNALFDEIRRGTVPLVTGGALSVRVNAADTTHASTRRVLVEHQGPLSAIVVVEGAYDFPAVGGGGMGSRRRYVFTAGSPTAIVRHSISWEGDRCGAGNIECAGSPNALQVTQARDTLALGLSSPFGITAAAALSSNAVTASVPAGQSASVRQLLRGTRGDPVSFAVSVPGAAGMSGTKADGALFAASGASGAVAIALDHMHRYEPQALRLLSNGQLAIDLVDDRVWLGARQSLFATLAVSALPPGPSRDDLNRKVWAPLNHPLRAWPAPDLFGASDAVNEVPVGPLPASLAAYDTLVPAILGKTLADFDSKGLAGLMTFGSFPRHWDDPLYADEIGNCGGQDPTPSDASDDAYWCSTWTDYHNASTTAPVWAMRTGDVTWLDEIATPAALRMLHTQIFQCAPGDGYFYCGQAPAGYDGFRFDFNSSHAYFDNLLLYYWLTGDGTVVDTLSRGAPSMRDYLCSRRPGALCLPDDPPTDEFANLTGRVVSQWNTVFRFLGLASPDPSFLADYKANLARAVTQQYVEAMQSNVRYGFFLGGVDPVTTPGTYGTDQLWLVTLYDLNLLDRLMKDTNDAPIGNPSIPPSRAIASWARTLESLGSRVAPGGDGTANGTWPNALFFSFTGNRLGGTLTGVTPNTSGGDPFLYDSGKSVLTATMVRAAHGHGHVHGSGEDVRQPRVQFGERGRRERVLKRTRVDDALLDSRRVVVRAAKARLCVDHAQRVLEVRQGPGDHPEPPVHGAPVQDLDDDLHVRRVEEPESASVGRERRGRTGAGSASGELVLVRDLDAEARPDEAQCVRRRRAGQDRNQIGPDLLVVLVRGVVREVCRVPHDEISVRVQRLVHEVVQVRVPVRARTAEHAVVDLGGLGPQRPEIGDAERVSRAVPRSRQDVPGAARRHRVPHRPRDAGRGMELRRLASDPRGVPVLDPADDVAHDRRHVEVQPPVGVVDVGVADARVLRGAESHPRLNAPVGPEAPLIDVAVPAGFELGEEEHGVRLRVDVHRDALEVPDVVAGVQDRLRSRGADPKARRRIGIRGRRDRDEHALGKRPVPERAAEVANVRHVQDRHVPASEDTPSLVVHVPHLDARRGDPGGDGRAQDEEAPEERAGGVLDRDLVLAARAALRGGLAGGGSPAELCGGERSSGRAPGEACDPAVRNVNRHDLAARAVGAGEADGHAPRCNLGNADDRRHRPVDAQAPRADVRAQRRVLLQDRECLLELGVRGRKVHIDAGPLRFRRLGRGCHGDDLDPRSLGSGQGRDAHEGGENEPCASLHTSQCTGSPRPHAGRNGIVRSRSLAGSPRAISARMSSALVRRVRWVRTRTSFSKRSARSAISDRCR